MKERISRRVAGIGESATLAVDAAAKALKAAGRPVLSFGAGEPDFATPAPIVEAAREACADPRMHRYSPSAGLPELREAVAAKTRRDSGFAVQAANVLVTNGGKQAVYEAFATLLDPGDEAIVISPYWTTYPEAIRLAGGVPVHVGTDETTGYLASVEQLESARTPRTKLLVFVSPSNPTGAVYTPAQVAEIGRWAGENGLWVVTDEIYEHFVYGSAEFSSIAAAEALRDRVVVVNGVAKTYAMTGWRVGWLVGPADVVKAATNLQSHATSNVSNVAQAAAFAALTLDLGGQVEAMRAAFDRRRGLIVAALNEIDGVVCPTPDGAFYAFAGVKRLLGGSLRGHRPTTSAELAEVVLREADVALVPGEAFGAPGYLRLSYALSDADLVEGLGRLTKLFGERD